MIQFDQSNKLSLQITSKATIRGIDIDVCHPSKMYVSEMKEDYPWHSVWVVISFWIYDLSLTHTHTDIRRHSLSILNSQLHWTSNTRRWLIFIYRRSNHIQYIFMIICKLYIILSAAFCSTWNVKLKKKILKRNLEGKFL